MALKPIPPRDGSGAERDRHARDAAQAKEFPHLWANGEEHVPEQIAKSTPVAEEVRAPAGRDADRDSERLVAVLPGTPPLPQADPMAGKSSKARGS